MAAVKAELRDFTGMTAEEASVFVAIESSPGLPARDLSKVLHANINRLLKVVDHLAERGLIYRRLETRVRKDGRRGSYNGLFVAASPVEVVTLQGSPVSPSEAVLGSQASRSDSTPPSALASENATITRAPQTPETAQVDGERRVALLELGKRLRWSRLPLSEGSGSGAAFKAGRRIDSGEEAWAAAAEALPDVDVDAALSAGRRVASLLGA